MKRFLLFGGIAATTAISLSSYNNGTYSNKGNLTGSNGSTIGCGSCHGGASSATVVTLGLLSNGSPVSSYTPGVTYDIMISAANMGTAHPKYGFQLTCGKVSAPATSVGTFGTNGVSGVALRASNTFLEHSTPLSAISSGTNNIYSQTFKWTAPPAGTGDVKFYAVFNAVNGNNNDDSGDQWNFGTSGVITEGPSSSVRNLPELSGISLYPNPAKGFATIAFENAENGHYNLQLIDITGKVVKAESIIVNQAKSQYQLRFPNIAKGLYQVVLQHNSASKIMKVVVE